MPPPRRSEPRFDTEGLGCVALTGCVGAFYAARVDLPRFSLTGPSRLVPVLEPGEEVELFGDAFEIERLPEPRPEHLTAAFVMTRRDTTPPGQAN